MFPTMSPLNRRPTRHSTTTCHINNGGNINKNGSNSSSSSSSSSSSLHSAGNEAIYRRRGIKNNSSCCSLRCGPSLAFFLASQRNSWVIRRWNNSSFGRLVFRTFSKLASTATYWKRRRPKTTIASFLLAISLSTYLLSILVLGPKGSIQGGLLGITVDQILRDCTYYKTIRKWRNQIQNELHIPIHYIDFFTSEGDWKEPLWFPYDPSIRSRSHAAVVEMLLREKSRSKMLERVATMSLGWKRKCSKGDILSGDIISSGRRDNGIAKVVWHLDPSILEQNRNINKNRSNFIHEGVAGEKNNLLPYWISRPSSTEDEIDLIKIYQTDMESSPSLSEIVSTCREYSNTIATEISSRSDSDFYSCWSFLIGGMQLGDYSALHFSRPQITSILVSLSPSSSSSSLSLSSLPSSTTNFQFQGGTCNSKLGYAVLSSSPSPRRRVHDDAHNPPTSSPNSKRVTTIFTALPPNHPASLCLPPMHHGVEIFPYNEINEVLSYQSTFANNLEKNLLRGDDSNKFIVNDGDASAPQFWGVATLPCSVEIDNENTAMTTSSIRACCNQVKIDILDSLDTTVIDKFLSKERDDNSDHSGQSIRHHLLFSFANLPHSDTHHNNPVAATFETVPSISVTISETANTQTIAKGNVPRQRKKSIQKELQSKWACEPGWLCNRCLKAAIFGSFSKCSVVCSKCFRETICNDTAAESSKNDDKHGGNRREVAVNVKVSVNSIAESGMAYPRRRIPRIIHQTYFDEITPTMYPQLYRLQNSWRASGWEYRFYNDEMARDYIRSNYPSRFLAVFDSLLPGAYKADFFRCLVLYKEGGLYADVDVMLETNLDTFLTENLSFVIPLDAVGSYADEQFCAWNGLIGSAPAHPILTKAIEWMVNHASDRADMYDMERSICHLSGKEAGMENWKIRAEPLLLLTGPCALGVAINAALGREPLARLEPGVLKRSSLGGTNSGEMMDDYDDIGDVLFLLGDKDDLGAFRFSDPDRNLIVASTDVPGLSGKPLSSTRVVGNEGGVRKKKKKKVKPHYSVTNGGQKLWGTHDVYADDLVDEEHITLVVSHDVV